MGEKTEVGERGVVLDEVVDVEPVRRLDLPPPPEFAREFIPRCRAVGGRLKLTARTAGAVCARAPPRDAHVAVRGAKAAVTRTRELARQSGPVPRETGVSLGGTWKKRRSKEENSSSGQERMNRAASSSIICLEIINSPVPSQERSSAQQASADLDVGTETKMKGVRDRDDKRGRGGNVPWRPPGPCSLPFWRQGHAKLQLAPCGTAPESEKGTT